MPVERVAHRARWLRWRRSCRPRGSPASTRAKSDIAEADFEAIVDGAVRVLVFWDAHGYHVADHVLGRLLRSIADRPHLVLMHDISDVRHDVPAALSAYGRHSLWRGNDWSGPRVRLGHFVSCVEQLVAAVDFTSRNNVPLHTAAEQIHAVIGAHRFRVETMERTLGDLWAPAAHWCHFSLNDRPGPYHFPAAARKRVPAPSTAAPIAALLPATALADVVLTPARHSQSLEIVVTGRSDDHGGPEFLERLVAAASHNHALLTSAGIAHTFTLVEWNPVPGRRLLAEAVAERLPFWSRSPTSWIPTGTRRSQPTRASSSWSSSRRTWRCGARSRMRS